MGTPDAGKLFLSAATGSGLEGIDLVDAPNFDVVALQSIYDIQAYPETPGRLTCKLRVEEPVQNRYRTLSGGCIGTAHALLMQQVKWCRLFSPSTLLIACSHVGGCGGQRSRCYHVRKNWLFSQYGCQLSAAWPGHCSLSTFDLIFKHSAKVFPPCQLLLAGSTCDRIFACLQADDEVLVDAKV